MIADQICQGNVNRPGSKGPGDQELWSSACCCVEGIMWEWSTVPRVRQYKGRTKSMG